MNSGFVVSAGAMTRQIQPLDVSVNKQLKCYLRKEYKVLLLSENLPLTPSGKVKGTCASKFAESFPAACKKGGGKKVEQCFKEWLVTDADDVTECDMS
jgi:hypothetical protein